MAFQLPLRPKDESASPPAPANYSQPAIGTKYSLSGFTLSTLEPEAHVRSFLEHPPFGFCIVERDPRATIINTVTLVFRTLDFYRDFDDMPVYIHAVAKDLNENTEVVRAVIRWYVNGRREFLDTRPSTQPLVPAHASCQERLICELVDSYIHHVPANLPRTSQRYNFFQDVRRRWTGDFMRYQDILDPAWVFPVPRTPYHADWLEPNDRDSDTSVVNQRLRRPGRGRGRGGRDNRRRSRSLTPAPREDRRRSPVRRRSPLRDMDRGRRQARSDDRSRARTRDSRAPSPEYHFTGVSRAAFRPGNRERYRERYRGRASSPPPRRHRDTPIDDDRDLMRQRPVTDPLETARTVAKVSEHLSYAIAYAGRLGSDWDTVKEKISELLFDVNVSAQDMDSILDRRYGTGDSQGL